MQTPKDILENQPWNLVEDEIIEISSISDDVEDTDIDSEEDDTNTKSSVATREVKKDDIVKDEQNIFAILAEDFTQKGIANFEEGWNGDEDEFREKIYEDVKASVLSDLQINDPIVSGFLQYVSNGGDPFAFMQQISMSSVNNASDEDVYFMYMKSTTNFSDEKIRKLIDRSKDLDEFEEEVEAFKAEIKEAQELQVKEIAKKQAQEKKERELQIKEDQILRKKLVNSKTLMGTPIVKNKEFEKFYLQPTETYVMDGKEYKITGYQKKLLEKQKNRAEYETFLAYLEFVDYNLPSEQRKATTEATKDLRNKLQTYITKGGKTTTLIDEI